MRNRLLGQALRRLVNLVVERALFYGFSDRVLVTVYLEAAIAFGCGFDTDPQFPWASKILNDNLASAQVRAEYLFSTFQQHFRRVEGERNELALKACRRLLSRPSLDEITEPHEDEISFIRWGRNLYPELFDAMESAVLATIFASAVVEAKKFDLPTGGPTLLAGLMLLYGHNVISDPMYPWIVATLENPNITSSRERLIRLFSRFRVYIEHSAKYLETTGSVA
jgi:hypothetical protein